MNKVLEFKVDKKVELTIRHFFVNFNNLEEETSEKVIIFLPHTDFYFGKEEYMTKNESMIKLKNEIGNHYYKYFDSFAVSKSYYENLKKTVKEKHNNYIMNTEDIVGNGEVVFLNGEEKYMYLIVLKESVITE